MSAQSGLPSSWAVSPLLDCAEVIRGITFPSTAKRPEPSADTLVCLRTSNVQEELEFDDVLHIPRHFLRQPQQWLTEGDTVISMANSYELVGKVALARSVPPNCTIGAFLSIIRSRGVDPKYVFYCLRSTDVQQQMRDTASHTVNISNLSIRGLRPVEIRVAPLPEQRRIVAAIESYLSRLDAATAALDRVQRNLARFRASVLHAAVTGRLVPTEAELARAEDRDYEPASVLLTRILAERMRKWEEAELAKMTAAGKPPKDDRWKARYTEPVAPNTEGLGELPEGWCWAETTMIADVIDPHPSHRTPPPVTDGIPYVGMGDVRADGTVDLAGARQVSTTTLDEHRERYCLRAGDFIFGKIGTLGAPALLPPPFDYTLSANVVLVQPSELMDTGFVFCWMQSPNLMAMVHQDSRATSQPALGIRRIRRLPIPCPPASEQKRIGAEVDRLFSLSREAQHLSATSESRCLRLRQSILRMAFEGRLVDQDPADESASVLLDRIKAERTTAVPAHRGRTRRTPAATQEPLL